MGTIVLRKNQSELLSVIRSHSQRELRRQSQNANASQPGVAEDQRGGGRVGGVRRVEGVTTQERAWPLSPEIAMMYR